jgi:hypothetical protein
LAAFAPLQPLVAVEPVAHLEFGQEETSKLISIGGVHRDMPGPTPAEFAGMEEGNLAVKFDGRGARYVMEDTGANSPFDFANGDTISLESWVKLDDIHPGENVYIVCKGRTGDPQFAAHNQNWALRLREARGQACLSFLFATQPEKDAAPDAHWHRWTTETGFKKHIGWHHIAVSYKFGQPESIRGWIDGQPLPGTWDMGGASVEAPIVDDDAMWIGSAQGGAPGNSFRGFLDAIAIHRQPLSDATVASRFKRLGESPDAKNIAAEPAKEQMPELGPVPAGRVLVSFLEGLSDHDRWPAGAETPATEIVRWNASEMFLPRLPYRYDNWGVRASWAAPVLVRLAGEFSLQPGERKFLVRARGLSRLWVNGHVVIRTKPHLGSSDGHQPVKPIPQPPLPGLRPKGYSMQEAFGTASIPPDGKCQIVFEFIVGGKRFRAEPGETLVAVQSSDEQTYHLLHAGEVDTQPIPLTEESIERVLVNTEVELKALDTKTRRLAATAHDGFWHRRHAAARQWAESHPVPQVSQAGHPVDAFIAAKIERALSESQADTAVSKQFYAEVHPILSANCFRCHAEKEKGGLKLNSRSGALKGGDSGMPAVVPGDTAESELIARIKNQDEELRMPPGSHGLSKEAIETLERWVQAGAVWPALPVTKNQVASAALVDDASFLRRAYFDTVGVPPTAREVREFLSNPSPDKRNEVLDRLLADERWADHWVSYWQDVLAENPNMLKPSLNNTGPFRWFLHESLVDNKPLDRLVTELVLLRGSQREGGAAGFGLAADNDAPFAAKGQILGQAFLGIDLQCARCHDSPYHSTTQQDLYALAAMMERKTISVPKTSTVPLAFFEKKERESLIRVTLKPGQPVKPAWAFAEVTGRADDASLDGALVDPKDTRQRLAALITTPENTRFAQVAVNRIWKRLIGAGIVEPVDDWEGHTASHPELLKWLAADFVAHGYDLKHLARTIMTSHVYQRQSTGHNLAAAPAERFFNAPDLRRLTAEQVVDALFAVSGRAMETEEITFDPDGRRPASSMISLGYPQRAWEFASLSNERDRPSLSLPRAQAICDVLVAFGWTGSRQSPRTQRETDPNVLQPGVLANSIVSVWVTRAARESELAELAVQAALPEDLVDTLFLRILGRAPTATEQAPLVEALTMGFADRIVPLAEMKPPATLPPVSRVTWSNHLVPEANRIKVEMERRARLGPAVDPRLNSDWRERYEDVVWTLINNREFVWLP